MKTDLRLDYNWASEHINEKSCHEVVQVGPAEKPPAQKNMDFLAVMGYRDISEEMLSDYIKKEWESAKAEDAGCWVLAETAEKLNECYLKEECCQYASYVEADYDKWISWICEMPNYFVRSFVIQNIQDMEAVNDLVSHIISDTQIEPELRNILLSMLLQRMQQLWKRIISNLESINRCRMPEEEKWNIEENKEELLTICKHAFQKILAFDEKQQFTILAAIFSSVWVRKEKDDILDVMRSAVFDVFQENQLEKLYDALAAYHTKSSLLYQMWCYLGVTDQQEHLSEKWEKKGIELCEKTDSLRRTQRYIDYPLTGKKDELLLFWLEAGVFCTLGKQGKTVLDYYNDYCKRTDGWNYRYEKSAMYINMQYYYLSVAAMQSEWLVKKNAAAEGEILYWKVWEKLLCTQYQDSFGFNVSQEELNAVVNIWARFPMFAAEKLSEDEMEEKVITAMKNMKNLELQCNAWIVLNQNLENTIHLSGQLKNRVKNILQINLQFWEKEEKSRYKKLTDKAFGYCRN